MIVLGKEVKYEEAEPSFDPNTVIPETQESMPPPSQPSRSQESKSESEEDENDADKESDRLTQQFIKSPKISSSSEPEKKRKKIKIPKKNQRPSMFASSELIKFLSIASLRISPEAGRQGLQKATASEFTKEVVKELSKKKKRKAKEDERGSSSKRKKIDKARSKARSPSPVVDDETIKEWQEKTKPKKKLKQVDELTEFDKMKQEALKILAPYTSPEYKFNPLLIGDPDPLVGSRCYYDDHSENIMKQMVVHTRFFKKGTTTNLFWNVSFS